MKNIEYVNLYLKDFEKQINLGHKSRRTFETYKIYLNKLVNWRTNDELLKQINLILANNCSDNTNFTTRTIFKIFVKWYSFITKTYIPLILKSKSFKHTFGTRLAFKEKELNILLEELENFNNKKFKAIFLILLSNGIRVSEWTNIDWNKLKQNNWIITICTAKKGINRPFKIPNHGIYQGLRQELENLNLKIKPKTIKNLFTKFSIFVKEKHPELNRTISSHILRHNFATRLFRNQPNNGIEDVARALGHKNSETARKTYIDYSNEYQSSLMTLATMEYIDAMGVSQLQKQLKLSRERELILEQELKSIKKQLKEKEILEANKDSQSQYNFGFINTYLEKNNHLKIFLNSRNNLII
ncbi:tyrosine-type recombinase/integrase [Mycoplasmopsis hyopharyngis]|uniref:tyrosine-type recombinase/integrase n=1 Tax=Mycoplasmopsis hyopharyngis TaxID=29558 RepID=UPI00387378B5